MLINLLKEKQPQWVRLAWEDRVKIHKKESYQISPETSIVDIFDQPEIKGNLLILGEPGLGKTVTLLELAKELISRAETDFNQPIPLWFNLAS